MAVLCSSQVNASATPRGRRIRRAFTRLWWHTRAISRSRHPWDLTVSRIADRRYRATLCAPFSRAESGLSSVVIPAEVAARCRCGDTGRCHCWSKLLTGPGRRVRAAGFRPPRRPEHRGRGRRATPWVPRRRPPRLPGRQRTRWGTAAHSITAGGNAVHRWLGDERVNAFRRDHCELPAAPMALQCRVNKTHVDKIVNDRCISDCRWTAWMGQHGA